LTQTFGTVVRRDSIQVKFTGQGHRSKFKEGKHPFLAESGRVKLNRNQFRQRGGNADELNWALQVSITSRKLVGTTWSEEFF